MKTAFNKNSSGTSEPRAVVFERCSIFLGVLILAFRGDLAFSQANAPEGDVARCASLGTANFSALQDAPTQITATQLIEAKDAVPAYCQVDGYVTPQIGFEIRLPTLNWNRKFLKIGCGAHCGGFMSCDVPLRKGYACIVSDMGHKGTGFDGLWAYNNPQAEIDWGYRATHVTALAGKAITERYYRTAPERSYFMGCSTGGRQGLVSAQRFPWDFDGIIAGAPPIHLAPLYMNFLWVLKAAQGEDGDRVLTPSVIQLLHEAAIARCDLDDGVMDGVIGNPPDCRFDPSEMVCKSGSPEGCLTRAQADAAKKIYDGVRTAAGEQVYAGSSVGSELAWIPETNETNPHIPIMNPDGSAGWLGLLAQEGFRYMWFLPDPGPAWKPTDFDVDRDYKRMGMMETLYSASNPDLRQFKAAGGKLIVYHGWNDEMVHPAPTTDYYETVERTMGGRKTTQDFFRLFMLPGINHCWGGRGADAVDFLGHLEAWVERGQAPEKILSAHIDKELGNHYPYRQFPSDPKKARFTRPVYPYPQRAVYKGKGDPNDAAHFRPVER